MLHTIVGLLLIALVCVYLYLQNNWIKTESCTITIQKLPEELDGMKIVHLSDLHLPCNASNVNTILKKIGEQNPDLILMTGDLVDAVKDIAECGFDEFMGQAAKIAPCYAIPGNHEAMFGDLELWEYFLTKNKIKVLRNECTIFYFHGVPIALAGLDHGVPYQPENIQGLEQAVGLPLILLEHQPQKFPRYAEENFSILPDLVLAGHAHGGQVRLPIIGGLMAPGQGLFPKYTSGLYTSPKIKTKMYVSRGLGRSILPFRINNRPHLPVLILRQMQEDQ